MIGTNHLEKPSGDIVPGRAWWWGWWVLYPQDRTCFDFLFIWVGFICSFLVWESKIGNLIF